MTETVILADDHPLFRTALSEAVRRVMPAAKIVEVASLGEAKSVLESQPANLLCLDLHMADSSGFAGLIEVRQAYPGLPVAVISASEAGGVAARALEFGAAGFIPKTSSLETLCEALAAIYEGDIWAQEANEDIGDEAAEQAEKLASLTPAQMRVLQGVASGQLNKQIAYEMDITEATVKAHITAVFRKLGVINRTQASLVAKALEVEPPKTV